MDYSREYSANMDWVREQFKLPLTASLDECVGRLIEGYREATEPSVEQIIEEVNSQKEENGQTIRRDKPPTSGKKRTKHRSKK